MNSQNPLFAVCVFSIAFLTAYGIQRGIKWEPRSQRYESMDGMRGFLAIISVMFVAKWKLNIEVSELIKSIFGWIFFTITGTPNINGLSPTWIVNAGVVWSLPYEWLFYFTLPLISLSILKNKPQTIYIFIFGFGLEKLKQFSSFQYCSVIIAIATPIVVIVSFLGFKYIEQPFMNRSKAIIQRLNAVNEL
jgi:peptidoglycan/LPS O-acetylase OafA/YrhL